MDVHVRVVSRQPPGGRCTLYAEVLATCLNARAEVVFSAERDAHGAGFPSLRVNGVAVQPADGVILAPAGRRPRPDTTATTGSACHAGSHAVSGALAAMGLTPEAAAGAIRLSLGRFTTEAEIDAAAQALTGAWPALTA